MRQPSDLPRLRVRPPWRWSRPGGVAGVAPLAAALVLSDAFTATVLVGGVLAFGLGYAVAARRSAATIAALERHAERDPLTGLCNRAALVRLAAAELALARRSDRRLVVAFADIDHFKAINDRFGHDVGDRALVEVARRLCSHTRRSDLVARFGGEEFVVLLRDTDMFAAVDYAERTRELVAATPARVGRASVPLSISIGLADWRGESELEALLRRADRALYAAKAAGRDRTAVADDEGGVRVVPRRMSSALGPEDIAAPPPR